MQEFTNPFPIGSSSLIHCMTNDFSYDAGKYDFEALMQTCHGR